MPKCLLGIWWDWESAVLRMCRIKCLALVCAAVSTLNLILVWDVLGNALHSNAKFVLTDRLELHFFHVRMPVVKVNRLKKRKFLLGMS